MDFAFSEEQEAFRDTLRRFLEEKSPTAEVFRLIELPALRQLAHDAVDCQVWIASNG